MTSPVPGLECLINSSPKPVPSVQLQERLQQLGRSTLWTTFLDMYLLSTFDDSGLAKT